MTAQEIAEHISRLPRGARVTVTFEVEDRPPSPTVGSEGVATDGCQLVTPQSSPAKAAPALLKLKEANAASGIPVRELQRAIKAKFLRHEEKQVGRDAGAYLVAPSDVALYKGHRERIFRGEEEAPEDWPGPKPS
jgi:hypothetical protein